jgi:hypothetical protein
MAKLEEHAASLTPDDVCALEAWLVYDGSFSLYRTMPPDIAVIVSKLCDRFWQTINENRGDPDGQ